jgi:4-amino-4-deoxy-L-arabinose transferase-like glycosyltransferase
MMDEWESCRFDAGLSVLRVFPPVLGMLHAKDRSAVRKIPWIVFEPIFLAVLGGYVVCGIPWVPFHGDESTLIRLSLDYEYLLIDGNAARVVYRPSAHGASKEQFERVLTGAVDPMTIGLARNVAGWERRDVNGFWLWYPQGMRDEWAFNVRMGNMPDPRLLEIARWPSALFAAASIIVVFAAASILSRSRPAAGLAAFLYATTPAVLVNGRRAMQEGAMLLFTSLTVLCAAFVLRELHNGAARWRRTAAAFVLLGLASGAALASKHTSALAVAPAYLAVLIGILSAAAEGSPGQRRAARIRWFFTWLGSGLLGLAVFYILMPVWWCYPLHWLLLLCLSAACFLFGLPGGGRRAWILRAVPLAAAAGISLAVPDAVAGTYRPILQISRARAELTEIHEMLGPDLPSFASRIKEMADQLLFAKTQYYESLVWDNLEEEQSQIQAYEEAHLDGRGGGTAWGIVVSALAAGGLWAVVSRRRGWEAVLLLLWFAVPAATLLAVNTLAWQRYYLILIAPWSVLAGFAALPLGSLNAAGCIRAFFFRRRRRSGSRA